VAYTSLTDPDVRDRTWRVLRELGTLIDPSNANKYGVEMVGFEVQLSATVGATASLLTQAEASPAATSEWKRISER
jgi:hypothetical protein